MYREKHQPAMAVAAARRDGILDQWAHFSSDIWFDGTILITDANYFYHRYQKVIIVMKQRPT